MSWTLSRRFDSKRVVLRDSKRIQLGCPFIVTANQFSGETARSQKRREWKMAIPSWRKLVPESAGRFQRNAGPPHCHELAGHWEFVFPFDQNW